MANSQLAQLKSALETYAAGAEKQSSGLQASLKSYNELSQQILGLIGGSSQGKDKEVEAAVNEARTQVERAAQALGKAANTAKQYAGTL